MQNVKDGFSLQPDRLQQPIASACRRCPPLFLQRTSWAAPGLQHWGTPPRLTANWRRSLRKPFYWTATDCIRGWDCGRSTHLVRFGHQWYWLKWYNRLLSTTSIWVYQLLSPIIVLRYRKRKIPFSWCSWSKVLKIWLLISASSAPITLALRFLLNLLRQ